MNCFYHPQTVAVALCKSCSKGLCQSCATEVENGIACKGRCETEVSALNQMIQKGKKSGSGYLILATFMGFMGVFMLVGGLLRSKKDDANGSMFLGTIFLVVGLSFYRLGRKFLTKT